MIVLVFMAVLKIYQLRDSQIIQWEMLQQFENLKFCGKNFEENTQQLLSSSDFFSTYISADPALGSHT